jgi:pyrimidine/purine-5'-nucleotide nucleosidase
MIRGIQEHLFAVLRDILYIHGEVYEHGSVELTESQGITNAVYRILRNAGLLRPRVRPDLVVCWGGHSISREEYDYTKRVGYEIGLRGLNVCTGCGPGAMKGPMKGATIGHSKQRIRDGRYVGVTEPGIVAAEPPNAIVNQLVILPDIEKRLEAFVRTGHGIIVFPGGAGTAEEILYLLGILLDPANEQQPLPVVFTGPAGSADYFRQIDEFLVASLGPIVRQCYRIVLDDPPEVAREMLRGMDAVREFRRRHSDAYNFNWLLSVPRDLQEPFEPTHAGMSSLAISRDLPPHQLAAQLRLLRHRQRQRQGAGHPADRGARALRDPRRPRTAAAARRIARRIRPAGAHEDLGRLPSLLPRRLLTVAICDPVPDAPPGLP